MSNESEASKDHGRFDRRTVLRKSVIATGGLTIGAVGIATADTEPKTWSADLRGVCREHPCRDENACAIEGTVHNTLHTTADGSGGFHLNFHSYWNPLMTAIGQSSGIEWSGQGIRAQSEQRRAQPPFPQTFTFVDRAVLTSEGATENVILQITVRWTINADGDATAELDEVKFECTGESSDKPPRVEGDI